MITQSLSEGNDVGSVAHNDKVLTNIRTKEEKTKSSTFGPMEIITKFPGYITRDDNGKIDYDIHPDFWDVVSESLEDVGFKPGEEIVVTISKTV